MATNRKKKLAEPQSKIVISDSVIEDMKKAVEKAIATSERLMASRVVPEEKLRRRITR